MTESKDYPYEEGDVVVLGPEIFASKDGKVISWKGENYVPQPRPNVLFGMCEVSMDLVKGGSYESLRQAIVHETQALARSMMDEAQKLKRARS